MLNLIIKDILIQKKQFIFSLLYLGLVIIAFQSFGEVMFSAGIVAFIYMINMTACAHEYKVKSDIMLNSLPIKRVNIVLQKYISNYIYFFMGTITYITFLKLLQVIPIQIKTYPLTFEVFMAGFIASSFMAGLYFPLYFKFGYMKMRVVNFVLFFLVFFGISLLARYLQGALSSTLFNNINALLESNKIFFIMAIVLIFAALMFISLSLAVYFYKKREF
jgi:ABC-2 type transport system permease protein